MAIRSGSGDKGFTDLHFKKRVSKDSWDICAIGDLDELNSYLGLIKCRTRARKHKEILEKIQHAISRICSEISVGSEKKKTMGFLLKKEDAEWIRNVISELEHRVRFESCFYIPGENELSAFHDIARAVARRAERSVVGLYRKEKVKNEDMLSYLNCVSDILFIMGREVAAGTRGKRGRKRGTKRGK
jgi:cob(I)alamin adenosyltransferase